MKKIVKKVVVMMLSTFILAGGTTPVLADDSINTEYELLELSRPKAGANLITNGGFENNGSGWRITGNGSFTNYSGTPYAGSYCGLLPSNSSNASVYQLVTLEKNTDYIVKAKVQFGAVGSQAFVAIKSPSVENLNPSIEKTITCEEGEAWVYKDVTFEFNSGNNTNVALTFLKWTEDSSSPIYKAQVYIDEVSLSKVVSEEPEDESYDIVWADEFNQSESDDANGLNLSNWGYELGSIRGVEQQHYTNDKENVHVEDGKLVLEVTDRAQSDQYKNPRGNRQVIYNSGSVRTHGKKEFLYGRIEILAKLPSGQATFPAFWTLGSDFTLDGKINSSQGDGWPLSGEIDIMESIGDANTVYETLHYSDTTKNGYNPGDDNGKYAGNGKTTRITTDGRVIDGETYHVFGINWSKGKMEWYVDDQIVRTVDYSDDPAALAAIDRPQYIQLNFATGGNWPGNAGTNLAGQTFEIEYVYYAQTATQKADAAQYYADTVSMDANDITIEEGTVADLISPVTLTPGSSDVDINDYTIDYSIDNEYMFTSSPDLTDNSTSNDEAQTRVDLLVTGVDEADKIASLPVGEYNIHYSAMSDTKPSVRKTVKLTVTERTFPSDWALEGIIGNTLSSISLPEGWTWDEPNKVLIKDEEQSVTFTNGSYSKTVNVQVSVKNPEIIAGNNSIWDKDSQEGLTFKSNTDFSTFVKVLVDDEVVDPKYYTVSSDSTIVTLSNDYLNTLSAGEHTITIVSESGEAKTKFTINKSTDVPVVDETVSTKPSVSTTENKTSNTSVKTGDQTMIIGYVVIGALSVLAFIVLKARKKENV